MISPLNILLIIVFMVVVPFVLGLLYERFFETEVKLMFSRCFAMGFATMLTLFQFVAVPMIAKGTSFNLLLYVYTAVLVAFIAVSLFLNRDTLVSRVKAEISCICNGIKSLDKMYLIIGIIALILIAFQTSLLVFKMHTDTDDCRFLAEALEAVERNTLLRVHVITGEQLAYPIGEMRKEVTAPYPLFISVLSVYTRIHPTVLAHLIFPVLLIPLSYSVVFLLGKTLLETAEKVSVYMFVIAVVILFSFESIYTWGYTLLTIIWQGRSISAVIMLPLIWYIFIRIYVEEKMTPVLFISAVTVGIANACLSGMGSLMAPIIGGAFALTSLIKSKKLIPAVLIGLSVVPSGIYAVLQILIY